MSIYTTLFALALVGAPPDVPADTPPTTLGKATANPDLKAGSERMLEIEAAEALLRAGDVDGARKQLAEAQKKNPRLAAAGVVVARWYLANNQIAACRAELERVVESQSSEPEAYVLFGELAWRDGRVAEADILFREALAKSKSLKGSAARQKEVEGQSHAGLATVAESRKRWSTARDELTAWAGLDERNPNPHQRLGIALFHLGKAKEAYQEFQVAAKQNPDFISEIALARLYEESGDRENATRFMNAAVKRLPGNLAVRLAVANWELETNQIVPAKREVEAILKTEPGSLDAKILAGGIARLQRDNPAAERYLEAAHLQSPTNLAASNLLALALADQDDAAKQSRALEFAQQNAEKYPRNSEAIATLGWAYFRLGRWDEADRTLGRALATGTLNADGAYFVAKMCEHAGRTADAKTWLSKALATKRTFAYQQEAEKMLAQLDGEKTAADPAATTDGSPKAP